MSITTPLTAPHGPAATEPPGGVPPARSTRRSRGWSPTSCRW